MQIGKLLVFAVKTSSIYQIETDKYNVNVQNIPDKISNKVNADGKKIVENKEVVNRLFVNGRNSCFITLKDHKRHFLNNHKIP